MATEKKVSAYICGGCGIGERLDTALLARIASREGGADTVTRHEFLCSRAGTERIAADIAAEKATHVVLAACSPRAKTEAFRFEGVAVSRANLREGVIWTQPEQSESREATQELANDYLRMACAEARFMSRPEASPEQALNRHVLVVGGGVSGLSAAHECARAGYQVTVVERSDRLGGFAARLHRRIPQRSPYAEPEEPGVADLIARVEADARISVVLGARLVRTSGAPGRFVADVQLPGGETRTGHFGAIIQATGFRHYDANRLPEFGYADSADVITQAELEELVSAERGALLRRPSNRQPIERVVFIQCAGQRSTRAGHLSYCSGFCCAASIKQAMYFKAQNPEIDTTLLYTDLRTPGSGGEDFYRSGQSRGITFTRGVAEKVAIEGESLRVRYRDLILEESIELHADLVVLATGLLPNSGAGADAETGTTTEGARVEIPVESILNLDYRQGRDLPQLRDGFPDSHFICFPYETRRTGIYAAGPVRRPMDLGQAAEDATGAALKAIQAIENAAQGRAVHPRSGDLSFPKVRYDGCTQCKRCIVECPFGAIDEDEERYPRFNESRCRRCATCMGACPVRVISFEGYSIDTVGQQIKSIEIPDESENKPRILVLACENDAGPALDMAGMNRLAVSAFARIIPVRCLGSVNAIWVTDALNHGFDGVMLMGCRTGEDYQCHFVKGSEMAHYRMSKIDDTLRQLDLEPERVATHEVAITDVYRAPALIDEMARTIERIGPSPLKF